MTFYRIFIIAVFMPLFCFSQRDYYYPDFFNAYYQNLSQVSPAYITEDVKAEFTGGYRSLTGAFRKVAGYYATGTRHFSSSAGHTHALGLLFYNEKEGSFISTPRYYARYAYLLPVKENTALYAGAAAGGISMQYSAPTTTRSSYTRPDGSIGMGIRSKWLDAGAAVFQIFSTYIRPVAEPLIFHRYYSCHLFLQKEWPSEWTLKGRGMYRIYPGLQDQYQAAVSLNTRNQAEIGLSYNQHSILAVFLLLAAGQETDRIELMISYNSTFLGNAPSWQNSLECGLRYRIW